jgi:outer membrane biosynthesis protein TonB
VFEYFHVSNHSFINNKKYIMKRVLLAICLLVGMTTLGIAQTKPVASAPKKETKKEVVKPAPATATQTTPPAKEKKPKHHKKTASKKEDKKG